MHADDEPVYLISVVAKVLNIHPQTLRQYEREGLIEPSRTDGKIRLYSNQDIDKIKTILRLTRELGVNLAGVDVILRLRKKLDELEDTIAKLENKIESFESNKKSLVKRRDSFNLIFYDKN